MNNELLEKMLKDVWVAIVADIQWGDSGKGKIVDLLAEYFDIIVRPTGGPNAAHTICINGKKYIFHSIPSGILHDHLGKYNIIGSGTVLDPRLIIQELQTLDNADLSHERLLISHRANLILPGHLLMDLIKEIDRRNGKIGTTGRGIGPAYVDLYDRCGLTMNDLLNKKIFAEKLKRNLYYKARLLKTYDREVIKKIMNHKNYENGEYFDENNIFNIKKIIEKYMEYAKKLRPLIHNTDAFIRNSLGKKRLLGEGAQGGLLDIYDGTYPFVTSSNPTIMGMARGMGILESQIQLQIHVAKLTYTTRVGKGAFPAEFGGTVSDEWCNKLCSGREQEEAECPKRDINDSNEFTRSVAIRGIGDEYGGGTKRPRRVGRFDIPLLRHAFRSMKGNDIAFTKADVMNNAKFIEICTHYIYDGPDLWVGERLLHTGDQIDEAIIVNEVLEHCRPVYKTFPGWQSDLSAIKSKDEIPSELQAILDFLIAEAGINPRILSIGPDRNQTIYL